MGLTDRRDEREVRRRSNGRLPSVYGLLFILFEIAAMGNFDPDLKCRLGRKCKKRKYFGRRFSTRATA